MELDGVFCLRERGFGLDTVVLVRCFVVMGNTPSANRASVQRAWPALRYSGSSSANPIERTCEGRVKPCIPRRDVSRPKLGFFASVT